VKHHDAALQRFVERVQTDPRFLGVIVTGSLARGDERPDSDIDLYLAVTDDRWDEAFAAGRLAFVERESAGYPGGYFDLKLVTLDYLDDAAVRGDDPVRESFAGARVAWSRVPDLAERVVRAATVPEDQWAARQVSFLAQARLHGGYFLKQGVERADPILTANAALHLATSAARALLALNHVLHAGPKYLTRALEGLQRKPAGIDEALVALVQRPSIEAGQHVLDLLDRVVDRPIEGDEALSRFVLDNELAWRYRTLPPEYA
jgi:hypothetical protein